MYIATAELAKQSVIRRSDRSTSKSGLAVTALITGLL